MISNMSTVLLLIALATTLAAPVVDDEDYTVIIPQKRAALVLDRLLIALQKALHEGNGPPRYERPINDGPRTAPLRVADIEDNDMTALQRRGQSGSGRGRVLRCYFNAVTCF